MHLVRVLAITALTTLVSIAFADDWPLWRGPNQDGIAPDTGINRDWNNNPPEKLWQVPLSDEGFAGPSVADGKVFIIDHEGDEDVVRAIDIETGEDIWEYRYPDLARADYGFSRSTPVYDEGRLYTISYLGRVICFDAESGDLIWSISMPEDLGGRRPQWGYAMSALIDGDRLILVPGGPQTGVAALNKLNGEVIWTGGSGEIPGYATPVRATIHDVEQYVVFTGKSLIGVRADDGELLWRVPWETAHDVNAATPIVEGTHVFITSGYGRGSAVIEVEPDSAHILREIDGMSAQFNTPVFFGNYLFGPTNPNLVCLDPRNGEVMWAQRGFGRGGVVVVGDVIIALSGNTGELAMIEATAQEYNELGRFTPLGGNHSWTAPIVAHGRLIVRNKEALACFDLR